jgi:CheY-like chemotaxis protein
MKLLQEPMHILFVDDDVNIRVLAQVGLEGLTDWHVELAESGYEALQKAQNHPPDLILLDIMMPGLDGRETFKRLREIEPLRTVPVIFITAKVQVDEVEQYVRLGANGVITKPFDPMSLPDEIVAILSQSTTMEKLSACA